MVKKRGIGVASIIYGTGYGNGFPDASSAFVEIHDDGTATVLTGAVDVGQGSDTVFAQIAAEELGIYPEDVTVISADTATTPDAGTTAATRQTYTTGNAVRLACQEAKEVMLERAARELGVNTISGLVVKERKVYVKGFPQKYMWIKDVATRVRFGGARLLGEYTFVTHTTELDPETGQGAPYWPYAFATQIAEVEVDTETGKVDVVKIVAAHDVGKAINKMGVEGQICGGVAQGVGYALMEEVELANGKIKNPNFTGYLMPTSLDMPEIVPIIIEELEPTGPYGAKGVGEPAMLPTAPAILNAIYDAVGVRINEMPATPEKILSLIKAKENNNY
ncbi:MAG: molybdopterin cofactor-binding domain-containing protein [Bacillota bacterium]|nr:molybdopterin cofactor-binding domain-containing protein [Bacillota bacterium]